MKQQRKLLQNNRTSSKNLLLHLAREIHVLLVWKISPFLHSEFRKHLEMKIHYQEWKRIHIDQSYNSQFLSSLSTFTCQPRTKVLNLAKNTASSVTFSRVRIIENFPSREKDMSRLMVEEFWPYDLHIRLVQPIQSSMAGLINFELFQILTGVR